MIQANAEVIRAFAHIAKNIPAAAEWITAQYEAELKRLPKTTTNLAVAQGRCQVLEELAELLEKAPSMAAKSNG